MVIDSHCHAGPGDGFLGPWDTDAPLEAHARRAERAGIVFTLIFPAFHSDYAAANEIVAGIVRRDPRRYAGLAFVHAARDRGRIRAMVDRCVRVHGFRGIKCHRYDARITREICDTARALRIPILYDVLGEVESADLLASQYPDVNFIIPHLGTFADDWRHQRNFIDILARRPNIYTDTSGVRWFDLVLDAIRRAGPHKIIFGSDGPWMHPALELAKIRAAAHELALPPAARALIEHGNAARLYRLALPAAAAA